MDTVIHVNATPAGTSGRQWGANMIRAFSATKPKRSP
jgi:hypothetical protein